jgi:hypothetical protein
LEFDKKTYIQAVQESHLAFMAHNWKAVDDFTIGFHTERICSRIDKAIEDYRNGKSSYISIAVHPRSGKSQIVSKYLPPHFLGEFPDNNVLSTTYNQSQAYKFSFGALSVVKSDEYKEIYPNIKLEKTSVGEWSVRDFKKDIEGTVTAASLSGGLSGKGAHLAILDDYVANREKAESPTIRDKTWAAFTDDFMTRLAPVHIVIILATPWHISDVRGRIKKKMEEDSHFPKFEFIQFPAKAEHYTGKGKYPGKYLFKERFNDEWYERQYATLDRYSAAALFDCSPVVKEGAILDTSSIKYHDNLDKFPKRIKWARVWDLGHYSKKGHKKNDPTGGSLIGFRQIAYNRVLRLPVLEMWVKDYIEFNKNPVVRDRRIIDQIAIDGPEVDLVFESTADSIDTVGYIMEKIRAIKRVHKVTVTKSKSTRVAPLEVIFEQGRVNILKGNWNRRWLEGIEQFDGSERTHDEMIDNASSAFQYLVNNKVKQKGANY